VFDGSKDITLQLPDRLKVSELKWFSVWCREFEVILGELTFPANFSFDDSVVYPGSASHDGGDDVHDGGDDARDGGDDVHDGGDDVHDEGQPEPEHGAAVASSVAMSTVVSAVLAVITFQ
jgi:hypothetical protein